MPPASAWPGWFAGTAAGQRVVAAHPAARARRERRLDRDAVVGRERAARVEQAAARPVAHARHDAGDGRQEARSRRAPAALQQGRGVGVLRVGEQARDRPAPRPAGRRTARPPAATVSATTPMSWVIRISAMPRSRCRSSRRSRICAWMVTSSAVVGSSAISSAGCRRSPWRSSPAGSCRPRAGAGRRRAARSGDGMPTRSSSSSARRRRSARVPPSCTLIALGQLEADREAGVERGHRLLEDHRHVLADDPAPPARAESRSRVSPGEGQPVGGDPARSRAAGP